ncbi:PEBP-like protein [Hesseltinella vesiculosa]|uniref:PEBP-like protein n=1 Tax=Hesseltinella vesiculosa TaxID=101127 RepID=A0A1X2GTW1_9FUNG|nr:PEBP-like protein [Hesseltinella vesiculosa]
MPLLTVQDTMIHSLKKNQLIPDVWGEDETISTSTMLQVEYPDNRDVAFGNTLLVSQTQTCPTVRFVPPDEEAQYTLMMIDPDAPSREQREFGPWRHWVVVNIKAGDVHLGQQHTPYTGPGPLPNSGEHRYIFLLFQQAQQDKMFPAMAHEGRLQRRCFAFKDFASDHSLELVAMNYFLCPSDQQ